MDRGILAILLVMCISVGALADEIQIKRGGETNGFAIVADEVFMRVAPRAIVKCEVATMETNVVETPRGAFNSLSIPGFQAGNKVGRPQVPMMLQLVEIPLGAEPTVRVISQNQTEYDLADFGIRRPLMPCQPSRRKDDKHPTLAYDPESYQVDEYSREPLANIVEVGTMRNYRIVSLEIAPVVYNPVQNKIIVHNDIVVEISLEGSDYAKTVEAKQAYRSLYFDWVGDRLLSCESLRTLSNAKGDATVGYAIVSDRAFEETLKPFIAAKVKKGFHVEVAYTDVIGNTKEKIQAYIHGLYKNPASGKPAPTFVLLVGDLAQIPAFSGTAGSYVTDLPYVAVDGDKIPEMLCGRFSAQNVEELVPQIEKTLQYESFDFPDTSFLKRVVMIAGWDSSHAVEWGYPQINYGLDNYFNKEHGFESIHKFLSSASHQSEAQIREAARAGASFINYTAHGSSTDWSDPSYTKTDIDRMTNSKCYPLVVGNCCLTNKFDVGTCFGEAWLRAKDKGAVGYIGGSSYTYWDEDLWWGVGNYAIAHPNSAGAAPAKKDTGTGAYDKVFENANISNAAFMLAGNLAVQASNSPRKVYYWEVYHLMGDPSLVNYWGAPSSMAVKHALQLSMKENTLSIEVEAGAYIGVTMNGVLHGAAAADETGKAVVALSPFGETGTALIHVTKQNRIPYTMEIQIVE